MISPTPLKCSSTPDAIPAAPSRQNGYALRSQADARVRQ
jgi:hypothetical protein